MIRYSKRDPYFRKKLLTSIIGQKLLDIEKITWVDPLEFKEKFAKLTSTIDIVLNEGKIFLGRRHTKISNEAPFVKYGGEIRLNHTTGKIDYSINASGHYPSSPEHFWEADAILDEAGFFAPNAVREPF